MRDEEGEEILEQARKIIVQTITGMNRETRADRAELQEEIRLALRRYFRKKLERRPMVLPYIVET